MAAMRFLFDTEFAGPAGEPRPERGPERGPAEAEPDPAETARAQGEEAGYARGLKAGRAEVRKSAETKSAQALERVAASCEALLGGLDGERARLEREAAALAVATARKLAPALVAREPLIEIAALAVRCLGGLGQARHVVVRVRAEHSALVAPLIETLARERGFEGRVVVLGEPDIAAGDARIEWAEGGFVRDMAAVDAEIEAAVAGYLAGHTREDEDT